MVQRGLTVHDPTWSSAGFHLCASSVNSLHRRHKLSSVPFFFGSYGSSMRRWQASRRSWNNRAGYLMVETMLHTMPGCHPTVSSWTAGKPSRPISDLVPVGRSEILSALYAASFPWDVFSTISVRFHFTIAPFGYDLGPGIILFRAGVKSMLNVLLSSVAVYRPVSTYEIPTTVV